LYEIRVYLIKDSRPGSSRLEAPAFEDRPSPSWLSGLPNHNVAERLWSFPCRAHKRL